MTKPQRRPANPNFSSGPCAKRPGYAVTALANAAFGRSHRSKLGKAKLKDVVQRSRTRKAFPKITASASCPASDTGAVEMILWSLLGPRPVDALTWESFGEGWVTDIEKQLKIKDLRIMRAPYGEIPDLSKVDTAERDVVFPWNGTTSGARIPNGDWIKADRKGLMICDATSAAFAMDLPWDKLDVVTWSWQKVLGGEAAHGMLVLSPRAVERLESYTPPWPLPKVFRLTSKGKISEGIFAEETINTPSMLAVEDAIDSLKWAESVGGLPALIDRYEGNLSAIAAWVEKTKWVDFLVEDKKTRSCTSGCLKVVADGVDKLPKDQQWAAIKKIRSLLDAEGVAYDIAGHRDALPGLRIWCGATIERSDVEALLPWLDWAFAEASQPATRGLSFSPKQLPDGWSLSMPKVLIADDLSPRAVEIFKERGVEVVFDTTLTPDQLEARDRQIRRSRHPLGHQGDQGGARSGHQPRRSSAAPVSASTMSTFPPRREARHRGDEHAVRQFDHHRGARHRADDGAGARAAGGRSFDPGGQVGKVALHGRRAHGQDRSVSSAAAISARSSPTGRWASR